MTRNTSMIKAKSISAIIFGDPQHHTLKNRVFNAVLTMGAFAGLCATLLNYYSKNPVREFIITILSTAIPIGFYIASRKYHADRYLGVPLIVIFLGILSTAWVTNQGSSGSTLAYFFILFVVTKIILDRPYDRLMLGISLVTVGGLFLMEYFRPDLIIPYGTASAMFLDRAMSMLICLLVITILVHLILKEYQNERARSELLFQERLNDKEALIQALTEIKILRGILPVCSFCKKIRDENNQWYTMESYISSHSEARFSHSFCPDCGRKYYPEHFQGLSEKQINKENKM